MQVFEESVRVQISKDVVTADVEVNVLRAPANLQFQVGQLYGRVYQ